MPKRIRKYISSPGSAQRKGERAVLVLSVLGLIIAAVRLCFVIKLAENEE